MDSGKKKSVRATLLLLVLLAFAFRAFPYLNGYGFFIDDGSREFAQVRFIESNGAVNWGDYLGSFPVIHLMVFSASQLSGFSSWQLMQFFPQFVSAFGVAVFFLFLRRHMPERHALVGTSFFAFFGPAVWWASLGVREAIAVVFLLCALLFFDSFLSFSSKKNRFFLLLFFLLTVLSHHWTSFIAVGLFPCMLVFLFREKSRTVLSYTVVLALMALAYWFLKAGFVLSLFSSLAGQPFFVALALFFVLGFLLFFERIVSLVERIYFFVFSSLRKTLLLFVLVFLGVFFVSDQFSAFAHPPYFYFSIFLLAFFSFTGMHFFPGENRRVFLSGLFGSLFLLCMLFSGFFYSLFGSGFVFDSFRAVEFFAIPLAFFAPYGFIRLLENRRKSVFFLVVFLVSVSGLLVFPPVFLLKQNLYGTPFYDVRSDLKMVREDSFRAIHWGWGQGTHVYSISWVENQLQWFNPDEEKTRVYILIEERDYRLLKEREKIKDEIFGSYKPMRFFEAIEGKPIYYASDGVKGFLVWP